MVYRVDRASIQLCSIFSIFLLLNGQILLANCDKHNPNSVRINKCCESFEILVDGSCASFNKSGSDAWSPIFVGFDGSPNAQVTDFWFAIGIPQCGHRQMFTINHDPTSRDRLALLPNGKLRHYVQHPDEDVFDFDSSDEAVQFWDYEQGKYCMDKSISSKGLPPSEFAMVCSPEQDWHWTDTDYLIKKIINPIFHGISISILLFVAITYFILPTLSDFRDLIGNIITTITCCLIVHQAVLLIRIFTELKNHVNFLVLDILAQGSMMAAFFWLSSLGYYIWKTFRSRNVFLRVADGTKYCWYSFFAWGSSGSMAALAIIAHLFLDFPMPKKVYLFDEQVETLGALALSIFFITIVTTIIGCIYFYVSTQTYLSKRLHASYGSIHRKLKANFVMYSLLMCTLTCTWIVSIFTWFAYDGLFYINFIISAIQAPLILYICVLRQEHVTHLLQKSCCSKHPLTMADFGDEMVYIDTSTR